MLALPSALTPSVGVAVTTDGTTNIKKIKNNYYALLLLPGGGRGVGGMFLNDLSIYSVTGRSTPFNGTA